MSLWHGLRSWLHRLDRTVAVYALMMGAGVVGTTVGMYLVASSTLVLGREVLTLDVAPSRLPERYAVDKVGNQTVVGILFDTTRGALVSITSFDPKQGIASLKQEIVEEARRDQTALDVSRAAIQAAVQQPQQTDQERLAAPTPTPLSIAPTFVATAVAPPSPGPTSGPALQGTPAAAESPVALGTPVGTPGVVAAGTAGPVAPPATPTAIPAPASPAPPAATPTAAVVPATPTPAAERVVPTSTATPRPEGAERPGGSGQAEGGPAPTAVSAPASPVPVATVPAVPTPAAPATVAPTPGVQPTPAPTLVVIPDTGNSSVRIRTDAPATLFVTLPLMVAGDSTARIVNVTNSGTNTWRVYEIRTSISGASTTLWTDPVNGLQLLVERLSENPGLVYDGPIAGPVDLNPGLPFRRRGGDTDQLKLTFYLPAAASNAVGNRSQIINLTWYAED